MRLAPRQPSDEHSADGWHWGPEPPPYGFFLMRAAFGRKAVRFWPLKRAATGAGIEGFFIIVFVVIPSLVSEKPVPQEKVIVTKLVAPPVTRDKPEPPKPKSELPGRQPDDTGISQVKIDAPDDPNLQRMEFEPDVRHQLPVVLGKFRGSVAIVEAEDFSDFGKIKGTPLMAAVVFQAPGWQASGGRGAPKQNVTGNYRLRFQDWERDPEIRNLVAGAGYNRDNAEVVLLFPYESHDGFDDGLKSVIDSYAMGRAQIRAEANPPHWKYVKLAWSAEEKAGVRVTDIQLAALPSQSPAQTGAQQ